MSATTASSSARRSSSTSRHRMSGFGGSWKRRPRADVERYPDVQARCAPSSTPRRTQVVDARRPAQGDRRGALSRRTARSNDECAISAPRSMRSPAVRRAVHDRAVARHRRRRVRNEYYDTRRPISPRSARRCRSNTRRSSTRLPAADRCARSRAGAAHLLPATGRSRDFLDFVERVVATINAALANIPRDRVRLHVCWGNYEGPHDCDVPLEDILPDPAAGQCRRLRAAVRQSAPRARIPLLREACRSPTTRSSSPA